MRKLGIAAVAACALASSLLSGSANAESQPHTGFVCGFTSSNDPSGAVNQNPEHNYGEIDGGPITVGDWTIPPTAAPVPGDGTLNCWLQAGPLYAEATVGYGYPGLAGASASGTGVLYLPPTPIEFDLTVGADLYECASIATGGKTWLWDDLKDNGDGTTGDFVLPGNNAHCSLAISAG
jgi:hypothetical protein